MASSVNSLDQYANIPGNRAYFYALSVILSYRIIWICCGAPIHS